MPRTQRSREIEFVENTIAAALHAAATLNTLFERTHGRQLPGELTTIAHDLVTIIRAARTRRQEIGAGAFVDSATSDNTGATHASRNEHNGSDG